jgi:uncharacterized protein YcbK (DUF882 family)
MGDLSAHFSRREFACKCSCGFDTVDAQLLEALEAVRQFYGLPVTVNSGCRCAAHNQRVGGSPNSQHLLGRAADIAVKGVSPTAVANYLEQTFKGRYGIGRYPTFTHIDTRAASSRWRG